MVKEGVVGLKPGASSSSSHHTIARQWHQPYGGAHGVFAIAPLLACESPPPRTIRGRVCRVRVPPLCSLGEGLQVTGQGEDGVGRGRVARDCISRQGVEDGPLSPGIHLGTFCNRKVPCPSSGGALLISPDCLLRFLRGAALCRPTDRPSLRLSPSRISPPPSPLTSPPPQ
ncbi:UNVERIFIED_CONTAM: hypothetical protein K2H54_003445 [Gekko kuhli]